MSGCYILIMSIFNSIHSTPSADLNVNLTESKGNNVKEEFSEQYDFVLVFKLDKNSSATKKTRIVHRNLKNSGLETFEYLSIQKVYFIYYK